MVKIFRVKFSLHLIFVGQTPHKKLAPQIIDTTKLYVKLCVRGYHIYQDIREAAVGETLVCLREPQNSHDRYAVAVKMNGTVLVWRSLTTHEHGVLQVCK